MNLYVCTTQLQLFSTFCQSYFIHPYASFVFFFFWSVLKEIPVVPPQACGSLFGLFLVSFSYDSICLLQLLCFLTQYDVPACDRFFSCPPVVMNSFHCCMLAPLQCDCIFSHQAGTSFLDDENVLKSTMVVITFICECAKGH